MRILDVGCGAGAILLRLRDLGFKFLEGIDPFLSTPLEYAGPVRIRNVAIEQVRGKYDLIMLHHVVEHVEDLPNLFRTLRGLVSPKGHLVVRVPVCDSEAFETYGADWVQLDAPRHLTIPTRKALINLGRQVGFALERSLDDSSAFQFWGSEQYRKDIPLTDSRSHWEQGGSIVFTPLEMTEFRRRAERANKMRRGDQTVFVFRSRRSVPGGVSQEGAWRKPAQKRS
jgi:SAM-dependent methyltransferase